MDNEHLMPLMPGEQLIYQRDKPISQQHLIIIETDINGGEYITRLVVSPEDPIIRIYLREVK